jgi:hypothetical protein
MKREGGQFSLIALPDLSILSSASVDIPVGTVDDHSHKNYEVKPLAKTSGKAPIGN